MALAGSPCGRVACRQGIDAEMPVAGLWASRYPGRMNARHIKDAIERLARQRGAGATFCPSEVARALTDDWQALMPEVRRVAAGMEGIAATQGGAEVDPVGASGPIRLGLRS